MSFTKERVSHRSWCVGAVALLAVSCTTGPNYRRPELNPPSQYKSAQNPSSAEARLAQDWWRMYNDAELDALIKEALGANLNLKAAMARVAQSRAIAQSERSAFYPTVSLDPGATRSRTPSANTSDSSGSSGLTKASTTLSKISTILGQLTALSQTSTTSGATTGTSNVSTATTASSSGGTIANRFQVPFDLSYEIDIWGRVRRSYESATAQAQASVYDLEVVRQTLLADLIRNYFNLRSFDAQNEILTRNLKLYQEQVDLTGNQLTAGLVSQTTFLQAQMQLESTRAQAIDTQRQRADLEHAVAILLGRAPAEFSLPVRSLSATPPDIPVGLPSDLLRQRPDVAEAEQNLVAACAEIGVAQAEFYPTVKLTGSAGFQSSDLKSVLDWSARSWSFGPSISLPIFNGGKLSANLKKAKARYEELEATYRAAVLTAFVDVEDSLTDLRMRGAAADSQAKAVDAAREYARLTHIEYQSGLTDYLHVISAEQSLLTNELSQAQVVNQRMVSSVLLIKALGGGWHAQSPEPVTEQTNRRM